MGVKCQPSTTWRRGKRTPPLTSPGKRNSWSKMVKAFQRAFSIRLFLFTALAAAVLVVAACGVDVSTSTSECEDGGELWQEYRLFMGRGSGGAEVVSEEDWAAFLADTITPRFPDGLSVIDVAGQGTSADGTLERERTKMLLILVPPTDETALNRMNEIGAEYKRRFTQDAVLRVITPACVAFK